MRLPNALFGCVLYLRCGANAGWENEQIGGQLIEVGENFGRWDDVSILGVHIAQADGVAGLAPIETALFRKNHPLIEAERVDHSSPHAA